MKNARYVVERRSAQKWLGILLTRHASAEESVIYPALALHGQKSRANAGYEQQGTVKTLMAALDELEPMSEPYGRSWSTSALLWRTTCTRKKAAGF